MIQNGFGFYKIACGVPRLKVANPAYNAGEIITLMHRAKDAGCSILLTPELSLTGATCGDLFYQKPLLNACEKALESILGASKGSDMITVVGLPVRNGGRLYNCAAVVQDGAIRGLTPKEYLSEQDSCFTAVPWKEEANHSVFLLGHEVWCCRTIYVSDELRFGIVFGSELHAPIPPSAKMASDGANLILNIAAENEAVGGAEYRELQVRAQSGSLMCAYAYCGAGVTESTTDLVYSGASLFCENGRVLAKGERFSRESTLTTACFDLQKLNTLRMRNRGFAEGNDYNWIEDCSVPALELEHFDAFVDPHPFVPADKAELAARCEEILSIQSAALAKRMEHIGTEKTVVGVSGGLDSTLALLVAVRATELLGHPVENVLGITLPGFGTTDRTYHNALYLMKTLGVTVREISIAEACRQHFRDIGQDENVRDITYENVQARERTQILMDVANKEGGILVGTGDLSEIAMGWCTYNADHMSMYGVNAGIPKSLMRHLVAYVASQSEPETQALLQDILATPVSPELLPPDENGEIAQKTEDKIGPYELHDFFLYHFYRYGFTREKIAFLAEKAFAGVYDAETIDRWLRTFLRRFFISQFKRSCTPDAPKVGTVGLSPRGDLKMPSDADFSAWLDSFC